MKDLFRSLLLYFIFFVTGSFAADNTNETETADTRMEQTEKGNGKMQQPTTETPETFVPSEEISEDLSVSFPVDI